MVTAAKETFLSVRVSPNRQSFNALSSITAPPAAFLYKFELRDGQAAFQQRLKLPGVSVPKLMLPKNEEGSVVLVFEKCIISCRDMKASYSFSVNVDRACKVIKHDLCCIDPKGKLRFYSFNAV